MRDFPARLVKGTLVQIRKFDWLNKDMGLLGFAQSKFAYYFSPNLSSPNVVVCPI